LYNKIGIDKKYSKYCGKELFNMAFQTSCVSAANIVTGLTFQQDVVADAEGREMVQHGSALFPIACYAENLKSYSVAWHWHEEFEYILAIKGPLTVDVNKTRVILQTNQGVFLNSGILHAVEHAEKGEALLHSGVFHPRLVGGMDTIFWQKLIRPMLQPNAPAFFLLDGAVPWQAQVLACLREAWQAVAVEPFDYENRVRYYLSAALRLLSTQCVGGKTKVSQQEQIAAERMKQMLRFVEEHYAEELTVERIAASVALSESACLRSFRQMLGITPIQYVKQFRVEKAAELLRSTRLKTGEIGMECGFADGSYFIKTFREIKHCTPKEYRAKFC
jgi:AraC-like DNA-binding protein